MSQLTDAQIAQSSDASLKRQPRRWLGPGLVGLCVVVFVLLWFGGDSLTVALRYERASVLHGEYWRLITAHWVHGSLRHMALNGVAALVIAALLARTYRIGHWLIILALSMACIDTGFLWLKPQLDWYVGASGVLHGALAAGAIAWWRTESRPMAAALGAVLIVKLGWEQLHGALPLAGEMPVVVDAHLFGALGGAVAATAIEILQRFKRS